MHMHKKQVDSKLNCADSLLCLPFGSSGAERLSPL